MLKIKIDEIDPLEKKTELLCLFVLEDSKTLLGISKLNDKIKNEVKKSIKEINGVFGKITTLNTFGLICPQRILMIGLGKKNKINNDSFRFLAGKIAIKVKEMNIKEFSMVIPKNLGNSARLISQIIEGVKLALYSFDDFKSKKDNVSIDLTLLTSKDSENLNAVKIAQAISEGVIFTRKIANLPPNRCFPSTLANYAKSLASRNNMKCKIFSKHELKKEGFGGIIAVGQGSKNEPKLIILEYKGGKNPPIAIVGKAVTFDTGGISIKPSEKMDEMKFDKCGGCTVLGIMKIVSELNLNINLIGVIPSVENMPGGESYRPGDIIKLYCGKTAEILNTDAEGRLILADALSYVEKTYSPKTIIDFATLTGACIVALGNNVAGLISNNDELANKLKKSSEKTAEQIWQLPLHEEYLDLIKSDVADMKNIGIGKAAGTITAAAFLRNSLEKTSWAHLDIAGVAWTQTASKDKPYNQKGATGFGVRLMMDYLLAN